ncbi:MAG: hypothetical protein BWZ06_00586 [Bacteroidetes bacterium ADurb.BinA261]|nr:MAG: hypothetical protein BWZ06_00586 [Bacteroidetes bacterium ADurb.BinA261]
MLNTYQLIRMLNTYQLKMKPIHDLWGLIDL